MTNKIEKLLFKKIELWIALLVLILSISAACIYGLSIQKYKLFPYATLVELRGFLQGDSFDNRTMKDRLASEVGLQPETKIQMKTSLSKDYYLLYGIFTINGNTQPTALLIDAKGHIKRRWVFPYIDQLRYPRRLQLSDKGTLVSNSINRLRAQSWCGESLWSLDREGFHHDIEEGILTIYDYEIVE